MFKRNKNKPIDPPKITATRVLILTLPVAIFLGFLVLIGEVPLLVALTGYMCILFLSLAIMTGFMVDLQSLADYAHNLSEGKDTNTPELMSHSVETVAIINSINKMHNVWKHSNNESELSISDAAVIDTIPEPLIFLNNSLDIVGSNLSAKNLFNSSFKNKKIHNFLKSKDFSDAINTIISYENDRIKLNYNENTKHFIIKIIRLPAKATGGATITISLTDVTLQKTAEQRQIEFFANASHELKTPLSIISGFVETIQNSAKDDPNAISDFLNIIKNQTDDMTVLINDLLCISKLESGIKSTDIKEIQIGEIISKQIQNLEIKANTKNISFNTDIEKDIIFFGSENDIMQIVRNLIDNAIKYGKENSDIYIKLKSIKNKKIHFSIRNETDNPIEKNEINKLCKRFYRTDFVKKSKIPGTGLGLSIVKAIVNLYNGEIEISSDIENGTNFTITLNSQND